MIEFLTVCIIIVVGIPCALLLVAAAVAALYWGFIAACFIVPLGCVVVGLAATPVQWDLVKGGTAAEVLVCWIAYRALHDS